MGALTFDKSLSASEIVKESGSFVYCVDLLLLFSIVSCVIFEVLNPLQAFKLLLLYGVVNVSLKRELFSAFDAEESCFFRFLRVVHI